MIHLYSYLKTHLYRHGHVLVLEAARLVVFVEVGLQSEGLVTLSTLQGSVIFRENIMTVKR